MYWLLQVGPSLALPGQKLKTFGYWKNINNVRTDRRCYQFKLGRCTHAMFALFFFLSLLQAVKHCSSAEDV